MAWGDSGSGSDKYPEVVRFANGATVDSFSRVRTSQPTGIFDCQFTYDLQPLVFEPIIAESGATITHDATNRTALMTFSSTPTGGKAYMQSYEYHRYQPGKSQLAFVTFTFVENKANCLKFAGLSDGINGFEFQNNGTVNQLVIYSSTTNGNQTVVQSEWSVDKFDGTGPSGKRLDITKGQILVIDFQALYKGKVRFYLDVDGNLFLMHEFKHANLIVNPYIAYANLPIRCGMTCTGTVSTTMSFNCSSVISEGGQEDITGYEFSIENGITAGNGTRTHVMSVQPKALFNSITNRSKYSSIEIDFVVTGSSSVYWELVIGQSLSGTTAFNDVNTTYSGTEYNYLGTLSGSPIIVIDSGYIAATNQSKSTSNMLLTTRYPMTLNQAGVARTLGRYTILAVGIGGTSATRCAFKWKEIR